MNLAGLEKTQQQILANKLQKACLKAKKTNTNI